MKLTTIKNAVTSKVGRQILLGRKHSPTILFVVGVAGVVGTVVLASRGTLKMQKVLETAKNDLDMIREFKHEGYSEQDRREDLTRAYVKAISQGFRYYGPAIALGTVSIAALTGSHVVLNRRNGALMAAYAVLDRGFREYRQRVVADLGKDKDREFRYGLTDREIAEETKQGVKITTVKDVIPGVSIYARCFEEGTSKNWDPHHSYNQLFLQSQQNYANDLLRARGHVFLNEVYDMLGLERSPEGAVVGWLADGTGDGFIDFGVFEGDRYSAMRFVLGHCDEVWLDFNVDGVIYDKI